MPGDSIFVSRPLGLTPAAFCVFLGGLEARLPADSVALLRRQFTAMEPMLTLGQSLGASAERGACIDNTDGIGQSLIELGEASKCAFVVRRSGLEIPPVVEIVSRLVGVKPLDLLFDCGAGFSLVGTLRGEWSNDRATARYGQPIEIIGRVEAGQGLWLEDKERQPVTSRGWNYFSLPSQINRLSGGEPE
jgi:thiamine-monophosphate kinase